MATKALTTALNNRKNIEAIENWICASEEERAAMELTPKQLEQKSRMEFADELLRKDRDKHHEIVDHIMKRFGVSKSTAQQDLREAQNVYASGHALNKHYTASAQIRSLQDDIRINRQAQNWPIVVELQKVLQKAIAAMEDYKPAKSPRVLVYNINNPVGEFSSSDKELDDAMRDADVFLAELEKKKAAAAAQEIPYEEVKEETVTRPSIRDGGSVSLLYVGEGKP